MDQDLTTTESGARAEGPSGFRVLPHSLEAEQALLGAILVNNEAYHRVADYLRAEHFYEPVHARLFDAVARRVADGRLADPVTLKRLFDEDQALKEVDGGAYLAALARAAEAIVNAEHYGRVIHDLALKRGLIQVGEETVNRAYDGQTDESGRAQIEDAESKLFSLAQEGEVQGDFKKFPDVLTNTIKLVESAYHKDGKVTGVPTALTGLDEKLGGLQSSDLIILAARPSMGKTALAVTMAANAATQRRHDYDGDGFETYPVAVFSLEMSAEQLAMRLLSAEARIGSDDLRKGRLNSEIGRASCRERVYTKV